MPNAALIQGRRGWSRRTAMIFVGAAATLLVGTAASAATSFDIVDRPYDSSSQHCQQSTPATCEAVADHGAGTISVKTSVPEIVVTGVNAAYATGNGEIAFSFTLTTPAKRVTFTPDFSVFDHDATATGYGNASTWTWVDNLAPCGCTVSAAATNIVYSATNTNRLSPQVLQFRLEAGASAGVDRPCFYLPWCWGGANLGSAEAHMNLTVDHIDVTIET